MRRTIEVRLVKKSKEADDTETSTYDTEIEGAVAHVCHFLDQGVREVGKVMISYVVVDTLRQVVVAKATKK